MADDSSTLPVTEQENPRSRDIASMPIADAIALINDEDSRIAAAVRETLPDVARAIEGIVARLERGGRWYYVGAGTSGRLAMLDASELRPTFGLDPSLVTVIMAGGERAFMHAAEGAEDDADEGAAQVRAQATARDVVVGVAASGTTPFTTAAVREAKRLGAFTVGISCRSGTPLASDPDVAIVVEVGPEVIMGSTRMKSGTAQKMILNALSTAVMVRLGHVYGDLMIDMPPTNEKLRKRAVRMVELAAQATPETAVRALDAAGGNVKLAVLIARTGADAASAREALARHGGRLRAALEG